MAKTLFLEDKPSKGCDILAINPSRYALSTPGDRYRPSDLQLSNSNS